MRGLGTAWGLGAALGLGGLGCGTELPVSELHATLRDWFQREGITLDAVACPHALPRAREESVVCQATAGPEVIDVTVTVTDDDGALSVRPAHATVVAARAEPEIAATLRAEGYAVTEVRCEGEIWVARAGAEHRCVVVDEDGRRFEWQGTWTGDGTKQRTRVVPLGPASGGAP